MALNALSNKGGAHISDRDAIMSAVMNAQVTGTTHVHDVDAVSGASLGVEGIIQLGRQALRAKNA